MFSPKRILVLLITSVLLTMTLYWIDSDPPSDNFLQMAVNTAIVLAIITLLYVAAYKFRKG